MSRDSQGEGKDFPEGFQIWAAPGPSLGLGTLQQLRRVGSPPEGSGGTRDHYKNTQPFIWVRNGGGRGKEDQFLQQKLEGVQWLFQFQSLSVKTVTLKENTFSPEVYPRDQSCNK